jgi:putative ABC transport system permease protein
MEPGGEDHGGCRSVHVNPEGRIMPKRILSLFRNLFRKRAIERALDDELRSTLEALMQEKMEQGLSQSVARREALIEIGGLEQVKQGVRAVRAGRLVEDLAWDIRYGLRQLRRNRSFTAVAVLTLALGIGGTTAIFSVVNGVLLQPLPYSHPERLVEVGLDLPGINQFNWPLSPPEYFTFREQSRTFQDIGLYFTGFGGNLYSANVTGLGRPEHVPALGVTDRVLPILGVTPLLGHPFTRADDEAGSVDVVMITYGYCTASSAATVH